MRLRGGWGRGNSDTDDNIGGHPKGAAAGVTLIVRHYNNVMNRIALGGKPNAGADAEWLDEMIGTPLGMNPFSSLQQGLQAHWPWQPGSSLEQRLTAYSQPSLLLRCHHKDNNGQAP